MINTRWSAAKAWGVHIFTASGLFFGFLAMIAIDRNDWRAAMAWLLVALFIDGIDGTLARRYRVTEVLPEVNGKTIDTVVDFTNYAVIPAYFFYEAGLAGSGWNLPLSFLILLVSAIYYGKDGMVSDDFYFVGFPVMWNIVVFYLIFVFSLSAWGNAAVITIFGILHFAPVKFAYPSRATRMKVPTVCATVLILILIPAIVWHYPHTPGWLKWLAVLNLAYFGVLAVFDTFRSTRATSNE